MSAIADLENVSPRCGVPGARSTPVAYVALLPFPLHSALLRYSWSGGSENATRRICCQIILPTGPWKIPPGAIIVPLF